MPDSHQDWPSFVKGTHICLAVCVLFELVSGLIGWITGVFVLYSLHQGLGIALVLVLLLQWTWMVFTSQGRRVLCVLFSIPFGLGIVGKRGARSAAGGRFPQGGMQPGLPAFMEGLLLLMVTAESVCGVLAFGLRRDWWAAPPEVWLGFFVALRIGALVVTIQVLGHIGMALVHALRGEPMGSMLSVRAGNDRDLR